jgi:hypothetical protein
MEKESPAARAASPPDDGDVRLQLFLEEAGLAT